MTLNTKTSDKTPCMYVCGFCEWWACEQFRRDTLTPRSSIFRKRDRKKKKKNTTARRPAARLTHPHADSCAARTAGGSLFPVWRRGIGPSCFAGVCGRSRRISCSSAHRRSKRTCLRIDVERLRGSDACGKIEPRLRSLGTRRRVSWGHEHPRGK